MKLRWPTPSALFTALALLIVLTALTLSFTHGEPKGPTRSAKAKRDTIRIAQAVLRYQADYGHLPDVRTSAVNGDLLTTLTGSNTTLNPRAIIYLKPIPAGKGQGGLKDGAFVDPWGAPYQIAIAPANASFVIAGTNQIQVPKTVAVWSDPSLATQPNKITHRTKVRYVKSWD